MDYLKLTPEYWEKQKTRVARHLERLGERTVLVSKGAAIPADGDLPIGEGRRLHMAVLFLDISNFSARPNNFLAEQKATMRAFTIFFAEMIRTIEDYDGTVEKNTGDGLMAYFEDTGFETNGCTRAVAAALTLQTVHRKVIAPILASEGLEPIDFRIGIDSGYVTVAEVGANRGFRGVVAIGTTANIASKILNFAKAEQIVIGDWVRNQLPSHWGQYIKLHTATTGFHHSPDGVFVDYPFYHFDAHWLLPEA